MRSATFLLVSFALLVLQPAVPAGAEVTDLVLKPKVINVDTFFVGGRVEISGQVPAAADCVVEVTGPAVKSTFDIKGRMGVFWMNLEQAELAHVPAVYGLLLPGGEGWSDRLAPLGLGMEHVKAQLAVSHTDRPKDEIFKMLLALKSTEGLYSEVPGGVTYGPAEGGLKPFSATLSFPSSVTCGKYTVTASTIAGAAKVDEQTAVLQIRESGFIKLVHDLARERSLVYGIVAVIIALLAGSIMGVLFKRGGGSH